MRKPRIYVAGPLTGPAHQQNVEAAIKTGDILLTMGFHPFVPHLDDFWHARYPHDYETWMEWDFSWLDCCDVLYRMPGESAGADREVARAKAYMVPVLKSFEAAGGYLACWKVEQEALEDR